MLPALALAAALARPPCQRAVIAEGNAGQLPAWHVIVCGGLAAPPRGTRWRFVIEGGPLRDGALIIAEPGAAS